MDFDNNPATPKTTDGVSSFLLTYSATIIDPAAYSLTSSIIFGRIGPGPEHGGPTPSNNIGNPLNPLFQADPNTNTNSLTFSGFTGNPVLTDTKNNLLQDSGEFPSRILNWTAGANLAGDRPASEVDWYVTMPGNGATYFADYGTSTNTRIVNGVPVVTVISSSPYNEATGFGFNIKAIPEPSTVVLLAVGLLGLAKHRHR